MVDGHVVGKPDLHEATIERCIYALRARKTKVDAEAALYEGDNDVLHQWFEGESRGLQDAIQCLSLLKRPDYQAAGHYKYHGD